MIGRINITFWNKVSNMVKILKFCIIMTLITISLKRVLTLYIKLQDLGSSGYMVLMRVRNQKIAINNKV